MNTPIEAIEAGAEQIGAHLFGDVDFESLKASEQETARLLATDAIEAALPALEQHFRDKEPTNG